MSWDVSFDGPIRLPSGKMLTTLRDAGDYIASLPVDQHREPKWQTAMRAVLLAADEGAPTMFGGIAMMQAISARAEPAYDPK